MLVLLPRSRGRWLLLAFLSALMLAGASAASAMASPGALFTQTNDPNGNTVQRFDRASDGTLTPAGTYPTGGAGLAGLGGRQGAVELSGDGRFLYAVNAGSNSVTAFHVGAGSLERVATVPSGGAAPVSIAERGGRIYVLNSGATPNVTAFSTRPDGTPAPIVDGTRELAAGASGAAQVSVAPDGRTLVVSERVANRLETLALDQHGRPEAPVVTPSSGMTPFGFAFSNSGTLVVSEAGASAVSSYRLGSGGALDALTPSLAVGQGGVCWVAVSRTGRYAYTGNASGSISGFAIGGGALTALDTTVLIPSPRDLDFDRSGRFLYAISPGNATTGGRVTGYRVGEDGALTEVTNAPAGAGITGAAAA